MYTLSDKATRQVANTSSAQVWFFVMSSRAKHAHVYSAHISMHEAKREARQLESCTRVGRIVDGKAQTL